jgi:acetyl esterase/lipase
MPIWALAKNAAIEPQPLAITGAIPHVYKSIDGAELRLHVFNPSAHRISDTQPAIVFFSGGGWTHGTVEQFVPHAIHLAQRGMVAIVADYRVFDRYKTTPFDAMADAKSAIRWLRSHAKELGIDPQRIAAAGGSAGGHIALAAALFDNFDDPKEDKRISSRPNALVLFNPAIDTSYDRNKVLFGDRGREASPIHHMNGMMPPMVIFHGKADKVIPYAEVEKFCSEARHLGDQCKLFGYDNASHGFFTPRHKHGEWYRETLVEMDRFLTSIGFLPAS